MTDAILRAYYSSTSLTQIPFPYVPPEEGAMFLLGSEANAFAFDATTYDEITEAAYVGGPVGGTVAVLNAGDPTDDLENVPLNGSNLTNPGTSPTLVHWPTSPYVRWAPHNYVPGSQTMTSVWTAGNGATSSANSDVAPDGTTTADTFTDSNGAAVGYYGYNLTSTLTSGIVFCYSMYLEKTVSATNFPALSSYQGGPVARICVNTDNGAVADADSGGGVTLASGTIDAGSYWRAYMVFAGAGGDVLQFEPAFNGDAGTTANSATTGSAVAWGAQVNRGYEPTQYRVTTSTGDMGIPQTWDAVAGVYGMWGEDTLTNLAIRSEEFDNAAWSKTDITVTADSIASPDGQTTADLITEGSAGTAVLGPTTYPTTTASSNHTATIYIKTGNTTWVRFLMEDNTSTNRVIGWFNISAGTVGTLSTSGSATAVAHSIVDIGGGWYRLRITGSNGASNFGTVINSASADASATRVSGSTYYLWGVGLIRINASSYSYIPTLGSSVARAQNRIQAETSTYAWSDDTSTAYADAMPYYVDAGSPINVIQTSTSGGATPWAIKDGGSDVKWYFTGSGVDIRTGTPAIGTRGQGTYATEDLNTAASLNGGAVVTNSVDSFTGVVVRLLFMNNNNGDVGGGTNHMLFRRMVYVPRRVTNGDLPTWRYNF